jgi:hypothetical protein
MENEVAQVMPVPAKKVSREAILAFEDILSHVEGATFGDTENCPLKHSFAEGVYVREIFIPKGTVMTGKIHRHSHPNFLMKGEVVVVTEDGGKEHLKAPLSMISKAGTKRVIYAIEDTVWITVHVTEETDLKKIEDYVIAPTFAELNSEMEHPRLKLEVYNCLIQSLKTKGREYRFLLDLEFKGTLLPFGKAVAALREHNVSLDGLYAYYRGNAEWHVNADPSGIALDAIRLDDDVHRDDMVGTWAGVAIGGGMVASAGINAFGGKGSVDQKPMLTDYQAGAQQSLLPFGRTGITPWGYDFTQNYGGSLGAYDPSALETQGLGTLASTLSMGNPGIFGAGTGELNKLLTTPNYDPNNDGGVYKGLTEGIDYNTDQAINATKRGSAFAGNLYSTDTTRNIGNINVQAANQKSNILAQLYQNFSNQKLSGASAAISAGATDQGMSLARVGASQQYGALLRTLQDQKAKDAYAAWQNQRSSELQPISALTNLSGMNANYGVSSVPIQSPWSQLLNTATTTGAYLYGMNKWGQGSTGTPDGMDFSYNPPAQPINSWAQPPYAQK